MAAEVSAADGALKAGAQAVAQSRGELQQQLKVLEGKLANIGGQWQGQGAVAFSTLMNRWQQNATTIINSLNEFESNLVSSQSTYTAADDQQSAAMNRLTSRLG
ncbi:WXG100 family type VII secretion target [Actinotalea sp. C106]|uniref:WXG100 family type VII secretion target n=1 Tax=Actinotalea sp. C106 TaxID=2908644 RepID=UPI002029942D|nr:WXG100 family type VII secretion target [Actinotalea sp. C106]